MSLPASRNTTYAPGTQIKSADLNDIQDQIIGGNHSDKVLLLQAAAFDDSDANTPILTGGLWLGDGSNPTKVQAAIPLHVGDRIKSITVYVDEPDASPLTATYRVYDMSSLGMGSVLDTANDASPGNAGLTAEVCTITGIDYTLTSVGAPSIEVTIPTGSTHRVKGAAITYDRP